MLPSPLPFLCEKRPASGAMGMVVTNAPLGSAAGSEMLAAGGNAIDAAVAALFALTVVEPMMVGIAGGGLSHIRLADGRHLVVDALATAGQASHPAMFTPLADLPGQQMEVAGRRNLVGPSAVAVPGNLAGWCRMQADHGLLPLADVLDPAIRYARRGFPVSAYLSGAIREHGADLAADPAMARIFLPEGIAAAPGSRIRMEEYADSLELIRAEGAGALYGGALGRALLDRLQSGPGVSPAAQAGALAGGAGPGSPGPGGGAAAGSPFGHLTAADLAGYRPILREAVFGSYRGHVIAGPPPPATSGVQIAQMLNILEHFDLARLGFGSADSLALLAEVIRIGFEDRRAASGDPAFVEVPVGLYTSKAYARDCLARLGPAVAALRDAALAGGVAGDVAHDVASDASGGPGADAGAVAAGLQGRGSGLAPGTGPGTPGPWPPESRDTTHVTTADRWGNIVSATHTINGLFGARFMVPGTGIIPNNYMYNFDPRPGRAMSIQPGKRVPTAMAPMIVLKEDRPLYALGLPGGPRIFPSALQGIVNLIDHSMPLQEAVEAPRLWTDGAEVELEPAYAPMAPALTALGYTPREVRTVGGGMNAIAFGADGMMTGAACWRADGTVMAQGGGLARPGIRFVL